MIFKLFRFVSKVFDWIISWSPPKPGKLRIFYKAETFEMQKFVYVVQLPPVGAADVVQRLMTVSVDGAEAAVTVLEPSADSFEVKVDQDSSVSLSLVDVDDVGNKSEPSVLEFVAVDDIAPPAPGAMGIVSVTELFEEPVAEEPVVEEPVAEEPVAEEPVVEEPVVEEPVAEEPVSEEPVVEEPVAEEPVSEDGSDEQAV